MKSKLEAWLKEYGHTNIKPIILEMFGKEYHGASYTFTGKYERGMDAVTHGDRKDGEEYQERRFYFIGEPPKEYLKPKNGKPCFIFDGETYYVSAYTTKKIMGVNPLTPALQSKYHPFGPSFMLGIWPTEKFGEIDAYERKKYNRIKINIKPE